jgi:hypothetical protein
LLHFKTFTQKQFKNKNTNNTDEIHITWNGQSDLTPQTSDIVLQIWDDNGKAWETLDTESLADANTDFDLVGDITENLSNYYADANWVTCRVYQLKA